MLQLPDLRPEGLAKDQDAMVMVAVEEETLLQLLPAVRPVWLGRLAEQRSQQLFQKNASLEVFMLQVHAFTDSDLSCLAGVRQHPRLGLGLSCTWLLFLSACGLSFCWESFLYADSTR